MRAPPLRVETPKGVPLPGVWKDPSSEMHLEEEHPFPCVAKELEVADRCLGTVVTLKAEKIKAALESVLRDLKEMSAKEAADKWRAEMAYYRQPPSSSASGFAETYELRFVDDDAETKTKKRYEYVAGRRFEEKGFDVICLEDPVARALVTATSTKARASGSVEFAAYDVRSFRVRLGSLTQGSTARAAIVAVRFLPLRPSHPGARHYEREFLESCLGLKDFTTHAPLPLHVPPRDLFSRPRGHCAKSAPFYDVDYLLNVLVCFRAAFFGADTSQGDSPPQWPPRNEPPLSLFPRAARKLVEEHEGDAAQHAERHRELRERINVAMADVNRGDIFGPPRTAEAPAPAENPAPTLRHMHVYF